MTWCGVHPVVAAITQRYRTGVTLSKEAMEVVERCLTRDPCLGKRFVTISPNKLSR